MTHSKDLIKVLIVDDSAFMRKILTDIINSDPNLMVVGFARNGNEAIEKRKSLQPDIITMDVEMPIMNGIEALKFIMKNNPLPVVMLSSLTADGAEATMTALDLGAVDFIQKPSSVFHINAEEMKWELTDKIKAAAKAKILKKFTDEGIISESIIYKIGTRRKSSSKNRIITIGTSTGGPKALQAVIPLLPADIPASILIVQHMPPGFTRSLAERLDTISQITVKEAENGEKILPGVAYVAPGDQHLEIEKRVNECYIRLSNSDPVSGHRPSVDVMFNSVAELQQEKVLAVIMTGMGSDGAMGLKELKDRKNAPVIAQDEESCVVYGMPKSAVKIGVVDEIVPLNKIANAILNRLEVL
ncbi:protein-glutamate methylesterase/protein-glutamine glutaminase [Alkaliphilus peptidifermentans]|uniref:Protein-glutamate methylesterase/protein-glutamine glutaminase n=1 Tax=Alkaliphilus peptidifermentans DSM 18978 TaxID=1120976 RepID=A0A1G5DFZ5_9FIRM|nr:chemotaxis response regulator protein-glutamate methylesterase [Alkaliphilus peptidifermentans]SCY13467.1 two-component system, chemotaxis family, response regulator CheB [Alkaliphilus peptidifermentans DSM 18978]